MFLKELHLGSKSDPHSEQQMENQTEKLMELLMEGSKERPTECR